MFSVIKEVLGVNRLEKTVTLESQLDCIDKALSIMIV